MDLEVVPGIVPSVLATLGAGETVFAEHGIVLYKEDPVVVDRRIIPSQGFGSSLKRTAVGGVPFFLAQFTGPGRAAFSRNGQGEVRVVELGANDAIEVAEGSLVCATGSLTYEITYVKGTSGRLGIWFDRLRGPGKFALHAYGNFVTLKLGPQETIVCERGSILHREPQMVLTPFIQRVGSGLMGRAMSQEMYTVQGPGTIGLQTGA
jgi:uncharacterized protein (AIM24 family)